MLRMNFPVRAEARRKAAIKRQEPKITEEALTKRLEDLAKARDERAKKKATKRGRIK